MKVPHYSEMLGYMVIFFLLFTIAQVAYLQWRISEYANYPMDSTAMAAGVARVCVNNRPLSIINDCNMTMPWGYQYNCTVNATDQDAGTSFTFYSIFITNTTVFDISLDGTINVTPKRTDLGNHTVRIIARDNSGCDNSDIYEEYPVEIVDSNHEPYLALTIPNASIQKYTSLSFYLNDYFKDPDGDALTYIVSSYSSSVISVTIENSSKVTVRGLECGMSTLYFIATDPYNLTATSNTIRYDVTGCATQPPGSGEEGGGGGGGGGPSEDCIPNWKCGSWSACLEGNTSMLECKDYEACDPDKYIQHYYKNCTYVPPVYNCQERWNCTEWSTCKKDEHTRSCFDMNSCGTKVTKPKEEEGCIPIASCFNGIQDGNETSIDCGGECGACKVSEKPALITRQLDTSLLIVMILTAAMFALIAYAFRTRIAVAVSALKPKKKHKKIYLKDAQKERLLELIYIIQTRFEEEKLDEALSLVHSFLTEYFKELLGMERLTREHFMKAILMLKDKELEKVISDFYSRMAPLNAHGIIRPKNAELQALIDEMQYAVYLVSEFSEKDAILCPKERTLETTDILSECYLNLSNLYIALDFNEITEAKKIYRQILSKYEKLQEDEKKYVYPDIVRVFSVMQYIGGLE